jgi:putative spermidine/putrescine transport system substrate-binding protein
MDKEIVATLPDQHTTGQLNLDMQYWADNRDAIGKRWYAWQTQ